MSVNKLLFSRESPTARPSLFTILNSILPYLSRTIVSLFIGYDDVTCVVVREPHTRPRGPW